MPELEQSKISRDEARLTVSVIIPVYNGASTIARAIDSALAQTYANGFEIVVINNGSTDETAKVIEPYGDRIIVVNEPTRGVSSARNAGVAAARGKYLAFLDADDEWMPEKLARIVPALEQHSDCVLAHHDACAVDISGKVCSEWVIPKSQSRDPSLKEVIAGVLILPSCTVMRLEIYQRCGGSNEQLTRHQDEYLFMIAREHGRFLYIPEVLARYEFVLSSAKEELWLAAGVVFDRAVFERYGVKLATSGSLSSFGLVHMARGARGMARQRYLAALRCDPLEFRTIVRLLWTFLPPRLSRPISRALPQRYKDALTGPPNGHWRCIAL